MQLKHWTIAIGCLTGVFAGNWTLSAQDVLPETVQEERSATIAEGTSRPIDSTTAADGERWRYKQQDGRWWYWLPSNRWVVWMDGRWVEPPTEPMLLGTGDVPMQTAPQNVIPRSRVLQPRPRSWYHTDRVYDGPYYYYDEFYSPYGGARPYSYYPGPAPLFTR